MFKAKSNLVKKYGFAYVVTMMNRRIVCFGLHSENGIVLAVAFS